MNKYLVTLIFENEYKIVRECEIKAIDGTLGEWDSEVEE